MRAMTLEYASPEQMSGGTVTTVSDVYSLGVVLYRLLTGKSPYAARTTDAQRIAEILSDTTPTRPSLVRPLDSDLDNILLMAYARNRAPLQPASSSSRTICAPTILPAAGTPRGNAFSYRFGKLVRPPQDGNCGRCGRARSLIAGLGIAIMKRAWPSSSASSRSGTSTACASSQRLFVFHDEIAKLQALPRTRNAGDTSLEYLDALYQESGTDRALQEESGSPKESGRHPGQRRSRQRGRYRRLHAQLAKAVALLEPLYRSDPKTAASVPCSPRRIFNRRAELPS